MLSENLLQLIIRALMAVLGMIENHLEASAESKASKGGVSPSITPVDKSGYNK